MKGALHERILNMVSQWGISDDDAEELIKVVDEAQTRASSGN
jgi:hypothetical protein